MPGHSALDVPKQNPVLLGDIGGTNIRFALYDGGSVGSVSFEPVAHSRVPPVAIAALLFRGPRGLAAAADREAAVVAILRRRFGHVSAERALSGEGLINLYGAIAVLDGVAAPERDAAQITAAALAHTCPVSRAALDMFCAMLGSVAGDLALMVGARGGVYVAGGIIPRIPDYLARSEFRPPFLAPGAPPRYI